MLVSIVVNYYNNERSLEPLLKCYRQLTERAKGDIELILVDDHSHKPANPKLFHGVDQLRVFRLKDDIAWNMPGARNVGALETRASTIFFSDVDHILEPDQFDAFVQDTQKLKPGMRIIGSRKPMDDQALEPHVNCYLIRRQDFFSVGGYEEMFGGHYGQDDKYFRYCCRWNGVEDTPSDFRLTALSGGATKGLTRDKFRNETLIDALISTHNAKARKAFKCAYEQIF